MSAEERKRLGLDRSITRREFIKLMAVEAGILMIPGSTRVSSDPPFNPISPTTPHAFIGGDTADSLASKVLKQLLSIDKKLIRYFRDF